MHLSIVVAVVDVSIVKKKKCYLPLSSLRDFDLTIFGYILIAE